MAGFPAVVASATAVVIGQNGSARLEGNGGAVVITAGPGWLPGSRMRYEAGGLTDDARSAAVRAGLLVTNLVFRVTSEAPKALPQAVPAPIAGLPLEMQVNYQEAQVSGIDRRSLVLYRFDPVPGDWQALASCRTLAEQSNIVCQADALGLFLLAGTRPVSPPAAEAGGWREDWWWAGLVSTCLGAAGLLHWRRRHARREVGP